MLPVTPDDRGEAGAQRHTIAVDADGIIDVGVHGVWTMAQVDRFFTALQPEHDRVREHWGRVLILIRVGSVQSPTVAMHVRDRALAIKRPGDRNAAVVATFLSKLQVKRVGVGGDFGVFTDAVTARIWLLEA